MKACPKCKSKYKKRMKRVGFIKRIPGVRKYCCDSCNTTYIWFPFFNVSLKY